MRILIVDDAVELVEQLRGALEEQHYLVDTAFDGESALNRILVDPYDLVLLDIMLPKLDGFTVLKILRREQFSMPVLMLTARDSLDDKVTGLDCGADDYLAKPFSMAELLARVRALLRRGHDRVSPMLTAGDLVLDTAARRVYWDKDEILFTPREFSILEFLLYNANRAVSRYTLAEHVWGDAFDPFTMSNSIDVHIRNIRRKLGERGSKIIQTVRGIGYMVPGPSR